MDAEQEPQHLTASRNAVIAAGGDVGSATQSRTLAEQRKARLLADADAQRLYNRIRQLQLEEGKAEKLIQATRKRTEEAEQHRRQKAEEEAAKQQRAAQQAEELERQRRRNLEMKRQRLQSRQQIQEELGEQLATTAAEAKQRAAASSAAVEAQRRAKREAAAARRDAVVRELAQGGGRLRRLLEGKARDAAGGYEARVVAEAEARREKEHEIARLAAVEAELIERLKAKQQEQQEALGQLEEALVAMGCSGGSGGGGVRTSLSVCGSRRSIDVSSVCGSSGRSGTSSPVSPQSRARPAPTSPRAGSSFLAASAAPRKPNNRYSTYIPGAAARGVAVAPAGAESSGRGGAGTRHQVAAGGQGVDPLDESVAEAFAAFDSESTGRVRVEDVGALLEALGVHLTEQQLETAQEQLRQGQLPGSCDDYISFEQFLMFFNG